MTGHRLIIGWLLLCAASACSDNFDAGTTDPTTIAPPSGLGAVVGPQTSALIARVSFNASGADSVRVAYREQGGAIHYTPFQVGRAGRDSILVLGLHPSTNYTYDIKALAGGRTSRSFPASFTTAALPAQLQNIRLQSVSGTLHHNVATGVLTNGGYALIFDSTGTIAWYHDFSDTKLAVSNVIMQPNGNITAFIGDTPGWIPADGYYVEMNPAGEILHTFRAPASSYMDDHEMLITGSGSGRRAHYLTFTTRQTDLSSIGMSTDVTLAGHQLRREDSQGSPEFTWDAWDNIGIDEWLGDTTAKTTRGASTDYDHPNAITFDTAGNYLVSWRNLDQIMAIDARSGAVRWRLGGTKSDFTFVSDPLNGFYKQHSVKMLPNGNVLLFDNGSGHVPAQSRAVEYRLDFAARTATMVWESRHIPPLFAVYVGWVERLANGNTWIAYSYFGRVQEVDPSGNVVWEGQLTGDSGPMIAYRIVPVSTLYRYVKP